MFSEHDMNSNPGSKPCDGLERTHGTCRDRTPIGARLLHRCKRTRASAAKRRKWLIGFVVVAAGLGDTTPALAARAHAAPAPEVEYTYDVMVRRHYNFDNPDQAIEYGHRICDKVSGGQSYGQVMGDVKRDVIPNDEFAANYLVSYAINLLCPAEIWQLRNSAAGYQPPPG
nr:MULTISPECIES: DUF732 domain-containing protein [Mycobacterium]